MVSLDVPSLLYSFLSTTASRLTTFRAYTAPAPEAFSSPVGLVSPNTLYDGSNELTIYEEMLSSELERLGRADLAGYVRGGRVYLRLMNTLGDNLDAHRTRGLIEAMLAAPSFQTDSGIKVIKAIDLTELEVELREMYGVPSECRSVNDLVQILKLKEFGGLISLGALSYLAYHLGSNPRWDFQCIHSRVKDTACLVYVRGAPVLKACREAGHVRQVLCCQVVIIFTWLHVILPRSLRF